jgi:hypothetical protein
MLQFTTGGKLDTRSPHLAGKQAPRSPRRKSVPDPDPVRLDFAGNAKRCRHPDRIRDGITRGNFGLRKPGFRNAKQPQAKRNQLGLKEFRKRSLFISIHFIITIIQRPAFVAGKVEQSADESERSDLPENVPDKRLVRISPRSTAVQ